MEEKLQQVETKNELFERAPIPRAVMTMSIPMVMSSLVMILYNLADTYFVGMLNDPIQNAAVTLAAPVLLAFNAVNNLFGVGGSSLMSRSLGRKDYDTVRKASVISFYGALFAAILFASACGLFHQGLLSLLGADIETQLNTWKYLRWTTVCGATPAILNVVLSNLVRSEGSSLQASIGTMSGCLLNILIDPFFILPFGLGLGAAGAGLATFLSNTVACLYFFVLLWVKRKKTMVCIDPRQFTFDRHVFSQIFIVGIPACIQNLLNVTSMTVLNHFTAAYGAIAVAAMGIAQKLYQIPMYMGMGFSQGVMPLVGYNFASGDRKRMRDVVLFSVRITVSILLLITIGYFIGSKGLIRLFIKNTSVVSYGSRFLRGMCLGIVFLSIDFLAVGVFQACGMGGKAFLFAILRKVILEIPALVIFNHIWPLYGLPYAQPFAEFILAIAAVILLVRILRPAKEAEIEN